MKLKRHIIQLFLLFTLSASPVWGLQLVDRAVPYAAPDASFTDQEKSYSLKDYLGQKVMLWIFSTWCHTCVAGVNAMEKQQALWNKSGLQVLAIRNLNNGGYPGASMRDFMKKFGKSIVSADNWQLGEATAQMEQQYNARKFPDIYFLVDERGMVVNVDTAPQLHMDTITQFARTPGN